MDSFSQKIVRPVGACRPMPFLLICLSKTQNRTLQPKRNPNFNSRTKLGSLKNSKKNVVKGFKKLYFIAQDLFPQRTSYTSRELYIFDHDSDSVSMYCTKIRVFEQTN